MIRKRKERVVDTRRKEATAALTRLAKRHGLGQGRFPPFGNIQLCETALRKAGLDSLLRPPEAIDCGVKTPDSLRQVLAILEAARMYAAGLASIQLLKNHRNVNPKGQAAVSLLAGLATDLGSIILLIEGGFDVQAKIVARTFGERLDLLIATQIDRAFAAEFVKNSDVDQANEFWKQKVAGHKLVHRVSNRLKRLSATGESPIDEEWQKRRTEMSRWLSMATHPSYLAGWFAFLPSLGRDFHREDSWDGENGLFGQQSELSIATGRAVFSRLIEFTFLVTTRKAFFEPESDNDSEMLKLVEQPKEFLGKALSECYFAPNMELFELYLAIQGYKLVRIEDC